MADKITLFSDDSCLASIATAMPNVSEKTLDAIRKQLEVRLKYASDADSVDSLLTQSVEEVSASMRRNLAARKWADYKNLTARNQSLSYINENFADKPFQGLEARMMGIQSYKRGTRLSAANEQRTLINEYVSYFTGELSRAGLADKVLKATKEFQDNIIDEMERIGQPHVLPDTRDNDAKIVAKILHDVQEKARIDANEAGASIGSLPGYIIRQTHDLERVLKMGKDEWKTLVREKLDWERIEKDRGELITDVEEYLDGVYASIASGTFMKHNDIVPSKNVQANVARSLQHDRTLHFKPGKWKEYNEAAGSRRLLDGLVAGLEKSATSTGLMRMFGPSAMANMDTIADQLKRKYPDQVPRSFDFYHDAWKKQLSNELNIPGNQMVAQIGLAARTLQNITKLHSAVITAFGTDPVLGASELKYQGRPALEGYGTALLADFKRATSEERMVKAKALGVMSHGLIGHFTSRMDVDGSTMGVWSKLNAEYFKWNFLTPHTDRLRIAFAETMGSIAASYSGRTFDELDPAYKRMMGLFDIGEPEWNLLRQSKQSLEDMEMVTLEGIDALTDEQIGEAYGGTFSKRQAAERRNRLRQKYHAYIIDRSHVAVLSPDKKSAVYQNFGTQAGTWPNELIRTGLTQFKGFPIAFIQSIMGREIYGVDQTRTQAAMRMGSMILQATIAGYGVMSAKDLLKGQEPRDFSDPEVLREAAMIGGGLGFYGDLVFGELKKDWNGGLSGAMLGPTASTVDDFADIIGRARDGDPVAEQTIKAMYRHMVPNTFYTKMVLDYAILYNTLDATNPNALRKMERRAEREYNRNYIVKPSEIVD